MDAQPVAPRPVASSFTAGVTLAALATLAGTALAQVPPPAAHPMLEWCRQMMAAVDLGAMLDACTATMAQAGATMRGMMGGMCMMGRDPQHSSRWLATVPSRR